MEDWLGFCRYCGATITSEDLYKVQTFDICADCNTVRWTLFILLVGFLITLVLTVFGCIGMHVKGVLTKTNVYKLGVVWCFFFVCGIITLFSLGFENIFNYLQ